MRGGEGVRDKCDKDGLRRGALLGQVRGSGQVK